MKYIKTQNGVYELETLIEKAKSDFSKLIRSAYEEELDTAPSMAEYNETEKKLKEELKSITIEVKTDDYLLISAATDYFSDDYEYGKVIKQSDSIEDLCDYEMHYDNGEFVIRPIKQVDWASLKRVIMNKWFKDCKLAIKTDRGLIYIARMNETTGDIELL